MKKIPQEQKKKEENLIKEVSFVEKELLLNSLTQQELLKTTKDLNGTIKELTKTLKVIERHEYLSMHKNKWKLVAYNLSLGILFAIGTVLGFLLLSWLTFNFFKDSVMLKQFIQNQLKLRNFDTVEMREKINNLTNPSPEKNDSPKETVEPSKTEMTGSGEIQP